MAYQREICSIQEMHSRGLSLSIRTSRRCKEEKQSLPRKAVRQLRFRSGCDQTITEKVRYGRDNFQLHWWSYKRWSVKRTLKMNKISNSNSREAGGGCKENRAEFLVEEMSWAVMQIGFYKICKNNESNHWWRGSAIDARSAAAEAQKLTWPIYLLVAILSSCRMLVIASEKNNQEHRAQSSQLLLDNTCNRLTNPESRIWELGQNWVNHTEEAGCWSLESSSFQSHVGSSTSPISWETIKDPHGLDFMNLGVINILGWIILFCRGLSCTL